MSGLRILALLLIVLIGPGACAGVAAKGGGMVGGLLTYLAVLLVAGVLYNKSSGTVAK